LTSENRKRNNQKKKNHRQNGPICRQHLPFVLFPLLLSYFVVLDLVITQTIQTPLSLYCYKNSPKNMIPPLLPGKKPKDLSIPHALNHSLTHSQMPSHESYIKCKVVIPVKQSKDSDLKGFNPSLLPILSTTDNTSKKRQQKKEEAKFNTHTYPKRGNL